MKNFLTKIKDSFKKKNIKAKTKSPINPHRHWVLILRTFFIIVTLLIIFSLYLLYQIKSDRVFQATPVSKGNSSLIKESLLKSVTEYFDSKSQKEKALKANPPSYGDPSL
jgi:hypothetical protein